MTKPNNTPRLIISSVYRGIVEDAPGGLLLSSTENNNKRALMYHNNQTPREDPAPHHFCHRTVTHKTISGVLINKELKEEAEKSSDSLWILYPSECGTGKKKNIWMLECFSLKIPYCTIFTVFYL